MCKTQLTVSKELEFLSETRDSLLSSYREWLCVDTAAPGHGWRKRMHAIREMIAGCTFEVAAIERNTRNVVFIIYVFH